MARTSSAAGSTATPARESRRLDHAAWVEEALTILAEQGIDGVRVEILAKRLGVTKGSFYWHFKDRDALLESLLDNWRRQATLRIISRLDSSQQSATGRLRQLLHLPFKGSRSERGANAELSIRLWSRRDIRAHNALAEVDQLRLQYIAGLLTECGCTPPEAKARAVLAYAFIRVGTTLIEATDQVTLDATLSFLCNVS
jgi:AcrR family transcriptional regulator